MEKITQKKTVTALRVLYPFWAVIGMFSIMFAPATAQNIITHLFQFRLAIAGSLLTQLMHIVIVLLLYKLFDSINKNLATLMVILALVGVPIAMYNEVNNLGIIPLLPGTDLSQVQTLITMHASGILIVQIFWGLWLCPLGSLIYKSSYFPKIIGVVVVAAGFGYLFSSFTQFLLPNAIFLPIFTILTMGEILFTLWLTIKGVKLSEK